MATLPRDDAPPEGRSPRSGTSASAPVAYDWQPPEPTFVPASDDGRVGYGRYARFTPAALALLLIAALAAIGLVQFGQNEPEEPIAALVGKPAPDVTLTLLDGRPLRLANLRGSIVVLNFWASWCEFCPDEMRLLQTAAGDASLRGDALSVVGVGLRTDQNDRARAMVRDLGLTYPIGRDTATDAPGIGPIERAFGLTTTVPATVFIRSDGVVDGVHLGPLDAEQLDAAVEQAREQSVA